MGSATWKNFAQQSKTGRRIKGCGCDATRLRIVRGCHRGNHRSRLSSSGQSPHSVLSDRLGDRRFLKTAFSETTPEVAKNVTLREARRVSHENSVYWDQSAKRRLN